MPRIEELQERLQQVNETAQDLASKAEAEQRDLTEQERADLDRCLGEFERLTAEVGTLQRLAEQTERLQRGTGRRTEPDPPGRRQQPPDPDEREERLASEEYSAERRQLSGGRFRPPGQGRGVPSELIGSRNGGFRSLGEMAWAVRRACSPGGTFDPRLERLATPTVYGNEGSGADGGFAVPPDFRQAIMEKVMGEDSLLARTDQLTSSSNTITLPKDETTPWQTSGGIQAYWEGEGQLKTQSKPALETTTLRLNKIVALVPMTDELLEDAPAMDTYLRRKAPQKINFKVTMAIIQGTGVGQPLGLLNSGALVTVAKESTQGADTIWYQNVAKMWGRLNAESRANAVWLVNPDVEAALPQMAFDPSATSAVPVYLPVNGIAGSPFATMFARPVVPTEACNPLGDLGDIILADLSQYVTAVKSGGLRTEVSIHLWFDYDITAYRFVLRVGGQPWWATPITPRTGSNTRSPFVTLAERA